jgi:hypothetical protein
MHVISLGMVTNICYITVFFDFCIIIVTFFKWTQIVFPLDLLHHITSTMFSQCLEVLSDKDFINLLAAELHKNRQKYDVSKFVSDISHHLHSGNIRHDMNVPIVKAFSNIFGIVVIVVTSTPSFYIQTALPRCTLYSNYPLIIGMDNSTTDVSFSTSCHARKEEDTASSSRSNAATNYCTCGKKHKSVKVTCIVDSRCPCAKQRLSCTPLCSCVGCKSPFGVRTSVKKKYEPCHCGESHKGESQGFCKTMKCKCFKNGVKCDAIPACICHGCENGNIELGAGERKRKACDRQSHAGKLIRLSNCQFMSSEGQREIQSSWTSIEVFLLITVQLHAGGDDVNMIYELYNTLCHHKDVGARGKTILQVSAKLNHLKSYKYSANK